MAFSAQADAPPLREDAAGAVRVGNSRVLLELIIRAFQDGATPEGIIQKYSILALPDVYAVIAYYLRNQGQVETYLAQREAQAEAVKGQIEANQSDLAEIRARLLARRASGE